MTSNIKKHDPVTALTECGIGKGHVHTIVSTNRFFVQLHIGATLLNKYLDTADEDKVWVRGHDVEKLEAVLATEAMKK